MDIPLIATKLNQPNLRAKTVPRQRLVDCLEAEFQRGDDFRRKLTLVSAPAGYGKTTLVAEWLKQRQALTGWVSLDEGDNDPRRFITYLLAAISQVEPGVGKAAGAMLQSPQPPPDEVLISSLVNEISEAGGPIILVLDDYHVIHTHAIHQQLAFLIDHQPANLHLVITTREAPLLPIPRLRARGQLIEVHQDDLRFTAEETSIFLKEVMGLGLATEEVAALDHRTEGWIAGLQLAALSMQRRGDLADFIKAFTGSNRFILDYLIEEVFEHQPVEIKDFLLMTSILDRLSAPLCNTVTRTANSQEILETIDHANLFIVPLDQSREWYRYHRLFADLLRHRLRLSGLDEAELHLHASNWFETHDFVNQAIEHALIAEAWERAGSLIIAHNSDFLKRGEVLTVIGWFQSLPEDILLSNPLLCFDYCWPLLLTTQYETAAPLLARIEESAQEFPEFLGEVYAAQAYLARGLGDHARMVERSQAAMQLLPKNSIHSRGIVAVNLGLAYWHMGQMEAAEEVLHEALEAGQATGNQYATLTALIFLGRVLAVGGQLHQAREMFEQAIQQGGEIPINALAHMDMADLHYEWNLLEKCEMHLQKSIELCQRARNYEFLVGTFMIQSRLRIAQGDLKGAADSLENAWKLVRQEPIPDPTIERLNVAQVNLLLAKGEPPGEQAEKLTERVDCHSYYRFLGVTKALALPVQPARAYLDGLSKAARENQWIYALITILILQAKLAESEEEGLKFLAEAVQLGEDGGFIRTFIIGAEIIPLLKQAAQQGNNSPYLTKLIAALSAEKAADSKDQSALVEPLSEREIEVLQLLAYGMTNRQIAEEIVVSISTVKSHVHHICTKLEADNRTQAVALAREAGLL